MAKAKTAPEKEAATLPEDSANPYAALNRVPGTKTEASVECMDEPSVQDETPLYDPKADLTPEPPKRYTESADKNLIAALELFERIESGRLLLPHAYGVRAAVEEVIEQLKRRVCRAE